MPRLAQPQVGNFLVLDGVIDFGRNQTSAAAFISIRGPMTVQRNRHPNFLRDEKHQLMLLGAATLVLLFFAWTYLD